MWRALIVMEWRDIYSNTQTRAQIVLKLRFKEREVLQTILLSHLMRSKNT
jgi:hypothetical protein